MDLESLVFGWQEDKKILEKPAPSPYQTQAQCLIRPHPPNRLSESQHQDLKRIEKGQTNKRINRGPQTMADSKTMVLRVFSAQPQPLRREDCFQGSCFFLKIWHPWNKVSELRLKPKISSTSIAICCNAVVQWSTAIKNHPKIVWEALCGKLRRNCAKLRRNYAKLRRNFCRIVWSILVETMVLSCFVLFCHLNRASRCVQTVLPFDTAPVLPNGSLNCEFPFATRISVLLFHQVVQEKGNIFVIIPQEL